MDLVVVDDAAGRAAGRCLMAEAQRHFWAQRVPISMALMPAGMDEYGVLRRAGYVRVPDLLTPRVFHFAYVVHDEADERWALSPRDWFVTFADYESY